MFKHGIEDGEEFAHACNQGHHPGFTGGQEALVKGTNDGIAACGHQGTHVEDGSDSGATALNRTAAVKATGISIKWSHSDEGSNLMAVERSQFRQLNDEGGGTHRSNAGNGLKPLMILLPDRVGLNLLMKIGIDGAEALLKPLNVLHDLAADRGRGSAGEAILF